MQLFTIVDLLFGKKISRGSMRLHCLGLNHRTAEIKIREKLAFETAQIEEFWGHLQRTTGGLLRELVVLSTCNRIEIYAVSEQPAFKDLEQTLLKYRNLQLENVESLFYRFVDEQVISHLMRVSSGLDSMVLGEPQILGQVTDAYKISLGINACGKVLSKLFQSAIRAGKRVRTETDISKDSVSISSLAANMAEQKLSDLKSAQITLLGAGEMAELAVEALKKRGANKFGVISRTISSACSLAEKWNGQAGTMEDLSGALEATDIFITSTSAPHIIIHPGMIEQVMAARKEHPLVIIDIAVPRDVSSEVGEIKNVSLFDIDDLNYGVEKAIENREKEIPKVEKIIDEEYQQYKEYFGTLNIVPIIVEMRQHADAIRQKELKKTLRKLESLNPEDREQIKALTHSIVKKILHGPTVFLREEANGPNGEKYASAASKLFGLNGLEDRDKALRND